MRVALPLCLAALGFALATCTSPDTPQGPLGSAPASGPSAPTTRPAVPDIHGMRWVPGGTRQLGAADQLGRPDEYPRHAVEVAGFWMDTTEVTNA